MNVIQGRAGYVPVRNSSANTDEGSETSSGKLGLPYTWAGNTDNDHCITNGMTTAKNTAEASNHRTLSSVNGMASRNIRP